MKYLLISILAVLISPSAFAATFYGQVVDSRTNKPVVRAVVNLNGLNHQTNAIGMIEVEDIDLGEVIVRVQHPAYEATEVQTRIEETTRLRIEMDPASVVQETAWLDVTAIGVVTNLPLQGCEITVLRFDDANASGSGTVVAQTQLDVFGGAAFEVEQGFYRVQFSKENWEPMTVPEAGAHHVKSDAELDAALKPIKFTMPFLVRGSRPEGNPISGGIDDAIIEIVGVHPLYHDVELTPVQQRITDSDGRASFENLPAISYRVEIKKSGYKVWEEVVEDFELAAEEFAFNPDVEAVFQLDDTTIEVEFESLYDLSGDKTPSNHASIRGLAGSDAEGVYFSMSNADIEEGRVVKRYERILPGLYEVITRNGGRKIRNTVLVSADETVIVKVDGMPAKSSIQGQLRLVNALRPSSKAGADSEGDRIFTRPGSPTRVVFQSSQIKDPTQSVAWFKPEWRYETTTDAQGRFQIDLPKGRYGITLPDLAGYTGYQINVKGGGDTFASLGWPFSEPNAFGAPIEFEQSAYAIELEVHKNFSDVLFNANPNTGTIYQTFYVSDNLGEETMSLLDVEAVQPTWSGTETAQILEPLLFNVPDVGESSSLIGASHSLLTFPTTSLDTSGYWGSYPGAVPPQDPMGANYIAPGLRHDAGQIDGTWLNAPVTPFTVIAQVWCPTCNGGNGQYNPVPSNWYTTANEYVTWDYAPDVLWKAVYTPVTGNNTVWIRDASQSLAWHRFSNVANGQTLNVYVGGPNNSEAIGPPVASRNIISVVIEGEDATGVDPGVPLDFQDGPATTGTTVGLSTLDTPTSADSRYVVTKAEYSPIDLSIPAYRLHVTLERQMVIDGVVSLQGGEDIPLSLIEVFGADGRRLAAQTLAADGSYQVAVQRQAVWVRIHVNGYILTQKRFDPPAGEDLNNADITMMLAPSPTINEVISDRYGNFIPGLLYSADPEGRDEENAKTSLTATFSIDVTEVDFPSFYEPFPFEDDLSPSTRQDRVVEAWIVDQRRFENPFLESGPMDSTSLPINTPTPLEWRQIREDLYRQVNTESLTTANVGYGVQFQPGNTIEVPLHLWKMAPGELDLVAVVVTESGAVATMPFARQDSAPPLTGIQLGSFGVKFLNIIGVAATYTSDISLNNDGLKKLHPGGDLIPDGDFKATIGKEPDMQWPGASYVTYDFRLGVVFSKAMTNSATGLVSLLPKNLGFRVGGEVSLKMKGLSGPAEIKGQGTLTQEFAKTKFKVVPSISDAVLSLFPIKMKGAVKGKASLSESVTTGENAFSGFTSKFSLGAFVEASVQVPLSILIAASGPIAAIVRFLERHKLRFFVELTGGVGGEIGVRVDWSAPTYLATSTRPRVFSALGESTLTEEATADEFLKGERKIAVKAGIAGGFDTRFIQGTLGVQLANQADADKFGVELTLNPDALWPLFSQVTGAFSIVSKVELHLPLANVGQSKQIDAPFNWQFGTDPYGEFADNGETLRFRSSLTTLPGEWLNQDGVLVGNFFSGGGFDAHGGLAFTNTNPETGEMSLFWAANEGSGYGEPVHVASAKGIDEVVIIPGDDPTLVWTELLSFSDIGNSFAHSNVMSSTASGDTWSEPLVLDSPKAWVSDLSASDAGVAWSVRTEHATSSRRSIRAASFDGSFGALEEKVPASEFEGFRVIGDNILVIDHGGDLGQIPLAGGALESVHEGSVISMSSYPTTDVFLVIADSETGLGVWDMSQTPWTLVTQVDTTIPRSLDAALTGDQVTLGWLANNKVHWAVLDDTGTITQDVEVLEQSGDFYSSLRLNETSEGPARFVVTQTDDFSAHLVEFELTPDQEPGVPGATPAAVAPLDEPLPTVDINDNRGDPSMYDPGEESEGCCRVLGNRPTPIGASLLLMVMVTLLRRRKSV